MFYFCTVKNSFGNKYFYKVTFTIIIQFINIFPRQSTLDSNKYIPNVLVNYQQIIPVVSRLIFNNKSNAVFLFFRRDQFTKMPKQLFTDLQTNLKNTTPPSFEKKSIRCQKCSIIVVRSSRINDVSVQGKFLPKRMKSNPTEEFLKR